MFFVVSRSFVLLHSNQNIFSMLNLSALASSQLLATDDDDACDECHDHHGGPRELVLVPAESEHDPVVVHYDGFHSLLSL